MNKKGFMRIAEATIAVMIVLGAMLLISSQKGGKTDEDLTNMISSFLEEIAKNDSLREKILSYNTGEDYTTLSNAVILSNITGFLDKRIDDPLLNFSVSICDVEEICYLQPYPEGFYGEIFSEDRIISTRLSETNFNPRKIAVFAWRNE